jgi:hypothetical protein
VRTLLVTLVPALARFWRTPHGSPNVWWKAVEAEPWIEDFCRTYPHYVLYGEVYGDVQALKYGRTKGEVSFRAFDVENTNRSAVACKMLGLSNFLLPQEFDMLAMQAYTRGIDMKTAPILYIGPYNAKHVEGLSIIQETHVDSLHMDPDNHHIGEGIVIKTADGRISLKLVSDLYLERAK